MLTALKSFQDLFKKKSNLLCLVPLTLISSYVVFTYYNHYHRKRCLYQLQKGDENIREESFIKRVIFEDAINSDNNTVFLSIRIEINTKLSIEQINQILNSLEKKYYLDAVSFQYNNKEIKDWEARELFTKFYDELRNTLDNAKLDSELYYPEKFYDIEFFPVWNSQYKCILMANIPCLKKDGFKSVERVKIVTKI